MLNDGKGRGIKKKKTSGTFCYEVFCLSFTKSRFPLFHTIELDFDGSGPCKAGGKCR